MCAYVGSCGLFQNLTSWPSSLLMHPFEQGQIGGTIVCQDSGKPPRSLGALHPFLAMEQASFSRC